MREIHSTQHNATVRAESDAYLTRIAEQQTWTGQEAALQLLLLPAPAGEPLPAYSANADYLDPAVCVCSRWLALICARIFRVTTQSTR